MENPRSSTFVTPTAVPPGRPVECVVELRRVIHLTMSLDRRVHGV